MCLAIQRVIGRDDALAVTNRTWCSTVAKWGIAESFAAVFGQPLGEYRAFGHNAGRVDVAVHNIIVVLDLLEVYGVAEARGLEQVAGIGPQGREFDELIAVAFEVPVVEIGRASCRESVEVA